MRLAKRFLWIGSILAGLSLVAMADPIDPDILIDPSALDATVLTSTSQVITFALPSPTPETFINETGGVLTSFIFKVEGTGLAGELASSPSSFTCPLLGFFQHCDIFATDANTIEYFFHGINPPDTESDLCDPENALSEEEGIPVFSPSCPAEDGVQKGVFTISFNGWDTTTATSATGTFTAVPEPAVLPMASLMLLGFGSLARRKVWKRN